MGKQMALLQGTLDLLLLKPFRLVRRAPTVFCCDPADFEGSSKGFSFASAEPANA
jgi:hypothetical protein